MTEQSARAAESKAFAAWQEDGECGAQVTALWYDGTFMIVSENDHDVSLFSASESGGDASHMALFGDHVQLVHEATGRWLARRAAKQEGTA